MPCFNKYGSVLGVHFDTSDTMLTKSISTALKVFVHGVEAYHRDDNASTALHPRISCDGTDSSQWSQGDLFFKLVFFIFRFFFIRLIICSYYLPSFQFTAIVIT